MGAATTKLDARKFAAFLSSLVCSPLIGTGAPSGEQVDLMFILSVSVEDINDGIFLILGIKLIEYNTAPSKASHNQQPWPVNCYTFIQ